MWFIGISFNQTVLFSVDDIICEHQKLVYLVCHVSFCQGKTSSNSLPQIMFKQI